ncbi:MAG TPA: ABC-2 family transporter protein [Candidatus Xenobia bacterium]
MRPYFSIFLCRCRALLLYRTAAAAAFGTRIFWGLIHIMVLQAFYRSSTQAPPMTMPQMVSYVWLGQAMLALVLWRVDADVADMVRTGGLACELIRPIDVYWMWYSRTAAVRVMPTVMQAAPIVLLTWLGRGLQGPPSMAAALSWGALTLVAVLLATAISTGVTVSMLYTVSPAGGVMLASTLTYALSGMLLPLPLFPAAVTRVLHWLPFSGLIDLPFQAWLGMLGPGEALGWLAFEGLWTVALIVAGRALLHRGLHRAVILGG